MIKATELRIGNYIQRCGYMFEEKEKFHDIIVGHNDITACVSSPTSFRPILLTNDLLIKFGARVSHSIYWISMPNLKAELHFETFNNTSEIVTTIRTSSSELILDRIRYAHELQNLFSALSGTELTLKK